MSPFCLLLSKYEVIQPRMVTGSAKYARVNGTLACAKIFGTRLATKAVQGFCPIISTCPAQQSQNIQHTATEQKEDTFTQQEQQQQRMIYLFNN